MDNITVILPIHRLQESEKEYIKDAIKSLVVQEVETKPKLLIVAGNEEVKKEMDSYEYDDEIKNNVRVVLNDGETDFCSQINFGVKNVETEWFSILEMDDEYSKIWFKNVEKYM
jgi:hypothetical protein